LNPGSFLGCKLNAINKTTQPERLFTLHRVKLCVLHTFSLATAAPGTVGGWCSHHKAAADNKREKPKWLPQQALAACLCCKKTRLSLALLCGHCLGQ